MDRRILKSNFAFICSKRAGFWRSGYNIFMIDREPESQFTTEQVYDESKRIESILLQYICINAVPAYKMIFADSFSSLDFFGFKFHWRNQIVTHHEPFYQTSTGHSTLVPKVVPYGQTDSWIALRGAKAVLAQDGKWYITEDSNKPLSPGFSNFRPAQKPGVFEVTLAMNNREVEGYVTELSFEAQRVLSKIFPQLLARYKSLDEIKKELSKVEKVGGAEMGI